MTESDTISYVEKMNEFDKLMIYVKYVSNVFALKNNFYIVDMCRFLGENVAKENMQLTPLHGYGKPDNVLNDVSFFYLWKDISIKCLSDFCSPKNVLINRNIGREYIVFNPESIYYYVYHNLN